MKNIIIPLLSAALILANYAPLNVQSYKVKKIVIDAGHGGKDPGCHGSEVEEADIALEIASELKRILNENLPDVEVVLTRAQDHFVELHERAEIANRNGADLFVSIHCNSASPSAIGTETFTMGLHKSNGNLREMKQDSALIAAENSVIEYEDNQDVYKGFDNSPMYYILRANEQSANIANSISLAHKIETQFKDRVNRRSRGVKQAGLLVLWKTTMPSVLVEVGFLTNSEEEKFLQSQNGQVLMASGIYRAIKEYKQEQDNQ